MRAVGVPVQGTLLDLGQTRKGGRQPRAGYHWQGEDRTVPVGVQRGSKVGDPVDLLVDPSTGKAGVPGSMAWMFIAMPAVVMVVMGLVLLGR